MDILNYINPLEISIIRNIAHERSTSLTRESIFRIYINKKKTE